MEFKKGEISENRCLEVLELRIIDPLWDEYIDLRNRTVIFNEDERILLFKPVFRPQKCELIDFTWYLFIVDSIWFLFKVKFSNRDTDIDDNAELFETLSVYIQKNNKLDDYINEEKNKEILIFLKEAFIVNSQRTSAGYKGFVPLPCMAKIYYDGKLIY